MVRQKEQEDQTGGKNEMGTGNQMTALRFQTGGDTRHPWPPFGDMCVKMML